MIQTTLDEGNDNHRYRPERMYLRDERVTQNPTLIDTCWYRIC